MTADPDVIVAGSGPGGALAAYELALRGIHVLLIEKESFPRYKVCGGGLTYRCLKELTVDVTPVIEAEIHSIRFSMNFKDTFLRTSPDPLMVCTMRARLDEFLVHKACEAGAEVRFNEKVTAVKQQGGLAEVETDKGTYHARILIGADGASGITARTTGLRTDIMQGLAWEAEIFPDPAFLEKNRNSVFLDWGTFPGGYGWIFPKKDHVSVGVGGPAFLSKHMMSYYSRFLKYAELERADGTDSIRAWPIPVKKRKGLFHKGTVLIVGDAAGLTDPLTGEGIYYAVRSGKLAAEACVSFLEGHPDALARYSEAVNDELMEELQEANRIKYLFNTVPVTIHHFVRDSDRAWRAFRKILRGERQYSDVKGGFGKWKNFWGFLWRMAKIYEQARGKRFLKIGLKEI